MIETNRLDKWERDCLRFNPFEGDRDVRMKLLRDGFLVTRVPHTCSVCCEQAAAHNIMRARTETFDGQIGSFYFCATCCRAMAEFVADGNNDRALMERYALGERSCEQRRKERALAQGAHQ